MRASLRLFRVFGIDVKVHITFLFIVAYFAYLWGVVYEPGGWLGALYGIILVVFLFALVTIHELTHSRVAQHYGIRVMGITLLPIGGMAQMEEIPQEPRKELLISVAGPLSNLVIGGLMLLGGFLLFGSEYLTSLSRLSQLLTERSFEGAYVYLTLVNIVLAVFNLLPAFPLDGGRVFRAVLALKLGQARATQVAVRVGQGLALLLGLWGLFGGGIFVLLVAVFIFFGASAEGQGEETSRVLSGLKVGQAVNTNVEYARPGQVVGDLAARLFHTYQEDFLVISEKGELLGILTRDRLIDVLSRHGRYYPVGEAMRTEFPTASSTENVYDTFARMRTARLKAIPVVDDGHLLGMLSLEDISEVYSLLAAAGPDLLKQVPSYRARGTAPTTPSRP